MTIKSKLKLYKNTYVKGECRSKEYERRIKQEKRLHERLDLTDILFNELTFPFQQYQKDMVKDLVRKHSKNFKKLHAQASQETIIVAFIFYVKKQENSKIQLQKYKIAQKYKLSHSIFETIICRLTSITLSELYIIPTENPHYDNNIHYKGEIND